MAIPCRVQLGVVDEALPAVLAHGLQEPVPGGVRRVVDGHHRLVDEPGEQVERVVLGVGRVAAHAVRRVEVEPAGEHRQPREQGPLALGQQPVGPVDRRDEALVARPASTREPPLTNRGLVVSRRATSAAFITRIRAAASSIPSGRPSSRRQISATEPAASPSGSNPADGTRPVGEQRRGVVGRQRIDRQDPLPLDAERLPAGGQHGDGRALPHHVGEQLRRLAENVLAVVQDEQQLRDPAGTRSRSARSSSRDVAAGAAPPPPRGSTGPSSVQRSQLAQPHPVGVVATRRVRRPRRPAGSCPRRRPR